MAPRLKNAFKVIAISTAFIGSADAQTTKITDTDDIEAAYSFSSYLAQNKSIVFTAGHLTPFETKQDRVAFTKALHLIGKHKNPKTMQGKALTAFCILKKTSNKIAAKPEIHRDIFATTKNGKPITARELGYISLDFANAINQDLFKGSLRVNNCPEIYKKHIPGYIR